MNESERIDWLKTEIDSLNRDLRHCNFEINKLNNALKEIDTIRKNHKSLNMITICKELDKILWSIK